jgi:DNA-directed RNA polymerase subunit M/transcription elongation factor TFIIS
MEIDRVEEWRRLKEHYAAMSDDELQAVAGDGWELTEVAQQALQAELSSRRLDVKIAAAPPPSPAPEPSEAGGFDPTDSDLAMAQQVWDLAEARRVKGILDAGGIPSYFGPNNVENPDELWLDSGGEIDVKVRQADQQRALQALRTAASESEPEYLARCPKCHSSEIVFQGLDGEPAEDATANSKFNWSCDACGYTWKDDGVEQEA